MADVSVDLTERIGLLFHQYRNSGNLRGFVSGFLEVLQDEVADPMIYLDQSAQSLDDAEGVWLDLIGGRLGFVRPGILDTSIEYFGFYDTTLTATTQENLGFDQGPLFTEDTRAQVRLPLGDEQYRNLLKARGLVVRSRASRAEIETVLDVLFDGTFAVADAASPPGFTITATDSRAGYITVVQENLDKLIPRQAGHPQTITIT